MHSISFIDRLPFIFNKEKKRLSNISGHGRTSEPQSIIYRSGAKYYFRGIPSGEKFAFDPESIKQITGDVHNCLSKEQVVADLFEMLYRYGFKEVTLIDDKRRGQ